MTLALKSLSSLKLSPQLTLSSFFQSLHPSIHLSIDRPSRLRASMAAAADPIVQFLSFNLRLRTDFLVLESLPSWILLQARMPAPYFLKPLLDAFWPFTSKGRTTFSAKFSPRCPLPSMETATSTSSSHSLPSLPMNVDTHFIPAAST